MAREKGLAKVRSHRRDRATQELNRRLRSLEDRMELVEPGDRVRWLAQVGGPWVHAGEPHRGEPRFSTSPDIVHRVVADECAFSRFERESIERGLKDAAIGLLETGPF